jgi:hypothetical protein
MKASGIGREQGIEGIRAFQEEVEIKRRAHETVSMNADAGLRLPPSAGRSAPQGAPGWRRRPRRGRVGGMVPPTWLDAEGWRRPTRPDWCGRTTEYLPVGEGWWQSSPDARRGRLPRRGRGSGDLPSVWTSGREAPQPPTYRMICVFSDFPSLLFHSSKTPNTCPLRKSAPRPARSPTAGAGRSSDSGSRAPARSDRPGRTSGWVARRRRRRAAGSGGRRYRGRPTARTAER